jgi:amidohydrolase
VAALLSKRQAELTGNVKFLFQPAEEGRGGANLMVQEGVMEGVDGVIGLHLMSHYPVGRVGVRAGAVFASADKFTLSVKGKGGHAAMPQEAVDPIVISAYIITALQTLISRESSPFSPAVITIGTIQAGIAFNIIPETVEMQGTVRTFSQEVREKWLRRMSEIAKGIASAMRGSCDVQVFDGPRACVNDASMAELVHEAAVASVGAGKVESSQEVMTTSSDDMADFLKAVPGCYFIVGARNEQKGASYPHHHPRFNIDEDAMPIAVEVLARAALDFLKSRTPHKCRYDRLSAGSGLIPQLVVLSSTEKDGVKTSWYFSHAGGIKTYLLNRCAIAAVASQIGGFRDTPVTNLIMT